MLVRNAIIMERFDVRSDKDRRRFVTRITAEYQDTAGDVYRKSFEAASGYPTVPVRGTHAELNAQKYQF